MTQEHNGSEWDTGLPDEKGATQVTPRQELAPAREAILRRAAERRGPSLEELREKHAGNVPSVNSCSDCLGTGICPQCMGRGVQARFTCDVCCPPWWDHSKRHPGRCGCGAPFDASHLQALLFLSCGDSK